MLSVSAFNALLKTLEEPPKHVIFLMATTEPDKLLGTVLSRCQRFDCRNVALDELIGHVKKISQKESIIFSDPKIIKQICLQGKGSVRDTLSLLDQVLSFSDDNYISEDTVALSLGLARLSLVKRLTSSLLKGDIQSLSGFYKKILLENVPVKNIMTAVLDYIYDLIQSSEGLEILVEEKLITEELKSSIVLDELIWIFEILSKDSTWILDAFGPEKVFEIALQKICLRRTFFNKELIQQKTFDKAPASIEEEKKKLSIKDLLAKPAE
jgi:DNA polymerase-3 subunit gamma/tau